MARPRLRLRNHVGRVARPVVCWLFGHREVRAIPHREICDKPWHGHTGDEEPFRFCAWCDSGWLA